MKITLTTIICLLLVHIVNAQFVYDKNGYIVPFSQTDVYKKYIDLGEVNTLDLGSYNNDSLYWIKNTDELPGNVTAESVNINALINFKEVATYLDLPDGNLWVYKITSPTAEQIGIRVKEIQIPEGCCLSFFTLNKDYNDPPETLTSDDNKYLNKGLLSVMIGNCYFVELFEPKGDETPFDFQINSFIYGFHDGYKKKVKTTNRNIKDESEITLKSGFYGTAANSSCQQYIMCYSEKLIIR